MAPKAPCPHEASCTQVAVLESKYDEMQKTLSRIEDKINKTDEHIEAIRKDLSEKFVTQAQLASSERHTNEKIAVVDENNKRLEKAIHYLVGLFIVWVITFIGNSVGDALMKLIIK